MKVTRVALSAAGLAGVGLLVLAASLPLAAPGRVPNDAYQLSSRSRALEADPSSDGSRMSNVIFLHHSVGSNLISQGDLRALLTGRGYELYDQGYNEQG